VRATDRVALRFGIRACPECGAYRAGAHSCFTGLVERDQQFMVEVERKLIGFPGKHFSCSLLSKKLAATNSG
jgi:hypothetical protein